jgi:hypothetical protein
MYILYLTLSDEGVEWIIWGTICTTLADGLIFLNIYYMRHPS